MPIPRRVLVLGALVSALGFDAAAQPRFGATQDSARHAAPPPASQETKPFAASPHRSPEAERCANFRRELRAARMQEHRASTTTGRDQAATHRQKIFESMQKAGC
jgi:hypothetical protein